MSERAMNIATGSMTVVIVNYNTRDHLAACLRSALTERPAEVIVVDNASTDGSARMVELDFPEVTLICAANRGFGAGANCGIARAQTPYVLLLNSDTRLYPGALAALGEYLDARPGVGMVGPKLVNPDGSLQPSIYPLPSPAAELMRWTSLSKPAARFPALRRRYFLNTAHNRAQPVGWVVGAALAIRKRAFDEVGGFDQSLFMYSEEVDLAYLLQKAGWQVHFAPVATIAHVGGASTEAVRSDMSARLFESMRYFYRKHYGRGRQAQLKAVITYLMIRNLLRDRLGLRSAAPARQKQLQQDMSAWQRVLKRTWSA